MAGTRRFWNNVSICRNSKPCLILQYVIYIYIYMASRLFRAFSTTVFCKHSVLHYSTGNKLTRTFSLEGAACSLPTWLRSHCTLACFQSPMSATGRITTQMLLEISRTLSLIRTYHLKCLSQGICCSTALHVRIKTRSELTILQKFNSWRHFWPAAEHCSFKVELYNHLSPQISKLGDQISKNIVHSWIMLNRTWSFWILGSPLAGCVKPPSVFMI